MTGGSGWTDSLADIRPYAITGGRTRTDHPLCLTSCLITRPTADALAHGAPETEALLLHCSGAARSVAELAALIHQPVQVVKVLVGDLLDHRALALTNPRGSAEPDIQLLEALLAGLHRL